MIKKNAIIILVCFLALAVFSADARKFKNPEVKYVFYLIGDGMGINSVYGAELYNRATGKGPDNINFLHFPVSTVVTTHSASSLVTDSAAAATALASGHKTLESCLGIDSEGRPVHCLADWAKDKGAGVGIATSVGVNHATPAAFYSHVDSRVKFADIIDDYIGSEVDFLAGSGVYGDKTAKIDASVLKNRIIEAGITVLEGSAMEKSKDVEGRLMCLDGTKRTELRYAIDQKEVDVNLSDFVAAGIAYLDGNYRDKGFLFVIEGGKIDYAGHSNDAAGLFWEVNDFAASVDKVLDFYNEHPSETLIVVTSDHDTGAISLGAGEYRIDASMLANQCESEVAISNRYRKMFAKRTPTYGEARDFLAANFGLWSHVEVDETFDAHVKSLLDPGDAGGVDGVRNLYSTNVRIVYDAVIYLAETSGFSWNTSTHSGSPVGLYVLGPGAENFSLCRDNTDIPRKIAEAAGYNRF